MSGKFIMKRKREEQLAAQHIQNDNNKRNCPDLAEDTSSSSSASSTTPATTSTTTTTTNTRTNRILMEALQKIIELQNELDAFEHDLDESEAHSNVVDLQEEDADEQQQLNAEVAHNFAQENRRCEAEALGFAMCARETLLFLQSEGVPSDSILYKSLLEKLVGQSDGLLHT